MDRLQNWDASKWWGSNFVDVAKERNNQWIELAADWGTNTPEQNQWWKGVPDKFFYDQMSSSGLEYTPSKQGIDYGPNSFSSSSYIDALINKWLTSDENAWLYDLSGIGYGGTGNVGKVAQDPSFGQFAKDMTVYREIQDAANKYGVPANFLQAIIAHESSGDWEGNNAKGAFWLASRNQAILPYVGVTADAVKSWTGGGDINSYVGNRRAQIDLLALGLSKLYASVKQSNPSYGWLNVAAMHYSGNPDLGANSTPSDSYQYGTTQEYVSNVEQWWKMLDVKASNDWNETSQAAPGGGGYSTSGMGSPSSSKWSMVNQWDQQVALAIARVKNETGVDVPGNVVKAIMQIESGGDPNVGVSPHGYGGLMQTGPDSMGGPWTPAQVSDPATGIYSGVKELALRYIDSGRLPWDNVIVGYFSGHYYPNGASDGYNSDYDYQRMFQANMAELNAGGSGLYGGLPSGVNATPGTDYLGAIFGGTAPAITQDFGPTEFSMYVHPEWYKYSLGLGFDVPSHPAIDLPTPMGTVVYMPFDATVEYVGPDYGYADVMYGGVGQIKMRLANGDVVIYGHMHTSNFQAGQQIKAGQAVGTTGGMNGDHLHLEYQTPDPTTGSGWRAVDPRGPFSGNFTGSYYGGGASPTPDPYRPQGPQSWQDILIWAAQGKSLEGVGAAANSDRWNLILRAAAMGSPIANMMTLGRMSSIDRANSRSGVTNVSGTPLNADQSKIVSLAQQYVGTPYVWAGADPSGWDCSGFVSWLYKNAWGMDISTGSHYQFAQGYNVPLDQLQPGDLVFYDTSGGSEYDNGNYASHVAMYIGGGKIVHAVNPGVGTIISSMDEPYYQSIPLLGARRYV